MSKSRINLTQIIFLVFLAAATAGFYLSDKYVVPVVMYHSVNDKSAPHLQNASTVNTKQFRFQMEFLKKNSYSVISLDELVQGIKANRTFSEKTAAITFDDGYDDVYTNGFRILKEYGFPATVFVLPDQVGKEGYMTWAQLKEMKDSGLVTVESHTLSHAYLPEVSEEVQRREMIESKRAIERVLGGKVKYLAYPVGGFTDTVKEIAHEAGYEGAFTTNRGFNRLNKDIYALKRIRFSNKDNSVRILAAKLSGYYNFFRQEKPSH